MFDLSVSKFEPPRVAVSPVRRRGCRTPNGAYSHLVTCRRLALLREGQWGRLQAVISKTANGRDFAKCGSFLYETVKSIPCVLDCCSGSIAGYIPLLLTLILFYCDK